MKRWAKISLASFGLLGGGIGLALSKGEVEWHLPEGREPYWRAKITKAEYEFEPAPEADSDAAGGGGDPSSAHTNHVHLSIQ